MNQNDKIKRLIEKYKDAHLRAPSNQARTIFEYMIEDLQALLDKECEHDFMGATCFNCGAIEETKK